MRMKKLHALKDELRFLLIVSDAKINSSEARAEARARERSEHGVVVEVIVSQHQKCARCWQRRDDVGTDKTHPELCGRCVLNVVSEGEMREFA